MSSYIYNPLLKKKLQLDTSSSSSSVNIPEYTSDPASPVAGETWVLRSGGGSGGGEIKAFLGLSFPILTPNSGGSSTYQLSFRTQAGTTVRTTLS